jgi:hypothetical protein
LKGCGKARHIPILECSTSDFNLHGEIFAASVTASSLREPPMNHVSELEGNL